MSELDTAIGRYGDGTDGVRRPDVTVVYSEFGRRVLANASQGTDHGTAGPLFAFGSGVRGGFHGERPSPSDLDDADLRFRTDFREVYATLLEDVLRTDPGPSLGPWAGRCRCSPDRYRRASATAATPARMDVSSGVSSVSVDRVTICDHESPSSAMARSPHSDRRPIAPRPSSTVGERRGRT